VKTIGVLAVQGAFARHEAMLGELGHRVRLVRRPEDLASLDGLVLPGGESTVQLEMIDRLALEAPLREVFALGVPILATCAGVVLSAAIVTQPTQRSFAFVDVVVARNAWGRQIESFEATSDAPFAPGSSSRAERLPLVFIRAPRIVGVGANVEVLATYGGEAILVRERNVTCATFHPELTGDTRVHAYVFGDAALRGRFPLRRASSSDVISA
jgi:pyridoxal 5'-phosphate synthase pdxT subunit